MDIVFQLATQHAGVPSETVSRDPIRTPTPTPTSPQSDCNCNETETVSASNRYDPGAGSLRTWGRGWGIATLTKRHRNVWRLDVWTFGIWRSGSRDDMDTLVTGAMRVAGDW